MPSVTFVVIVNAHGGLGQVGRCLLPERVGTVAIVSDVVLAGLVFVVLAETVKVLRQYCF